MGRKNYFQTSLRTGLACAALMLASSVMAQNHYFKGAWTPDAPKKGEASEVLTPNKPRKAPMSSNEKYTTDDEGYQIMGYRQVDGARYDIQGNGNSNPILVTFANDGFYPVIWTGDNATKNNFTVTCTPSFVGHGFVCLTYEVTNNNLTEQKAKFAVGADTQVGGNDACVNTVDVEKNIIVMENTDPSFQLGSLALFFQPVENCHLHVPEYDYYCKVIENGEEPNSTNLPAPPAGSYDSALVTWWDYYTWKAGETKTFDMFVCVGDASALDDFLNNLPGGLPDVPYSYSLKEGQYLDNWTETIQVLVDDQAGGDLTKYAVNASKILVKNALTQAPVSATFDADGDGEVDVVDGKAVLTIKLSDRLGSIFSGKETTYYQVDIQEGALATDKSINKAFSVNFSLDPDPELEWTAVQDPDWHKLLFKGEKTVYVNANVAFADSKVTSQMPINDVADATADADALTAAFQAVNKVKKDGKDVDVIAGVTVTSKKNTAAYVITLVEGAEKDFNINLPKEVLSVAAASHKNDAKVVAIKVTNPDAIQILGKELKKNEYQGEAPEKISKYYVQFTKDGNPVNVQLLNEGLTVIGANQTYTLANGKIKNIADKQGEALGMFEIEFTDPVKANSDFIIYVQELKVVTADKMFANAKLLECEMIVTVNTDFTFNDTSKEVTKVSDINGRWNIAYGTLTYNRTLVAGKFNPLAVPFEITGKEAADNNASIYRLNAVVKQSDEEGNEYYALKWSKLGAKETAYANRPYIIKAEGADLTMKLTKKALYKPGVDKILPVYHTKATINDYAVATYPGKGVKAGSLKSEGKYTEDEADEWNLNIPGAIDWKYSDAWKTIVNPVKHPYAVDPSAYNKGTGVEFKSVTEVKIFNRWIAGAKQAGDRDKTKDTYYTEDEAYAYNVIKGYNDSKIAGETCQDGKAGNETAANVECSTTTEEFAFYTTSKKDGIGGDMYYLNTSGNLKNNNSAVTGKTVTLGAWRWFMTMTGKKENGEPIKYVKVFVDDEEVSADEATAIQEAFFGEAASEIFNLNGQKVAAPVKGINIINGKKVLVK